MLIVLKSIKMPWNMFEPCLLITWNYILKSAASKASIDIISIQDVHSVGSQKSQDGKYNCVIKAPFVTHSLWSHSQTLHLSIYDPFFTDALVHIHELSIYHGHHRCPPLELFVTHLPNTGWKVGSGSRKELRKYLKLKKMLLQDSVLLKNWYKYNAQIIFNERLLR